MFKAVVMEIKDNYIIVMKEGGEVVRINKKGNLKVGETIFCLDEDIYIDTRNNKNRSLKTWLIPLGAVAALMIILINPIFNMFSPGLNNTYAVLTFDVNPSIEFDLNDDGKILDIKSIKGLTVEEGSNKLKELLTNENYLGNGNSVLVGFSFLGTDNMEFQERIENMVKTTFNETNVAFMKGTEESLSMAKEQGISLGKYEAILKLDEDGLEEAFENLSTQELLELLKVNNSNVFLNEDALDELQDEIEDRLEDENDDDYEDDEDEDNDDDNDNYDEDDD